MRTAGFGTKGERHHTWLGLEVSVLSGLIGSVTSQDPTISPYPAQPHSALHNTSLELLLVVAAVVLTVSPSPVPPALLALVLAQTPAIWGAGGGGRGVLGQR